MNKIEIITINNIGFPSPYTHRIEILANEKKIEYSIINVDLYNKPRWFIDIAPLGQVPLMKVGNTIIADSKAICDYLDNLTQPSLLPVDLLEKAKHNSWWFFANEVANEITKIVKNTDLKMVDLKHINDLFKILENNIKGPYFFGNKLSTVDIALVSHILWIQAFEEYIFPFSLINRYKKLNIWLNTMLTLESVVKTAGNDFAINFIKHIKMRGYIK